MGSTSETGHAKNLANFENLINFVTGYGTTYNPAKDSLKIPNLNTIATKAQTSLSNVLQKNTEYNNALNNRYIAFENLKSLSTRLINSFQTTEASDKMIEDAKGFNRKLQGSRARTIPQQLSPDEPAPTTISVSQQSYDQQIQHFAGLISILQSEPSYKPNESELKIETLTAKQNDLIAKNNAVSVSHTVISNARIARNKALYGDDNGLVDIASEVKKYIKSVYGSTSPEFGQVSAIKFKKEKI